MKLYSYRTGYTDCLGFSNTPHYNRATVCLMDAEDTLALHVFKRTAHKKLIGSVVIQVKP